MRCRKMIWHLFGRLFFLEILSCLLLFLQTFPLTTPLHTVVYPIWPLVSSSFRWASLFLAQGSVCLQVNISAHGVSFFPVCLLVHKETTPNLSLIFLIRWFHSLLFLSFAVLLFLLPLKEESASRPVLFSGLSANVVFSVLSVIAGLLICSPDHALTQLFFFFKPPYIIK